MYNITLRVLKDAGNERMWFNTALKLAKLHVQTRSYKDAGALVLQLRRCAVNAKGEIQLVNLGSCNFTCIVMVTCPACSRSCSLPDGSDDATKGTQLVEIYALEIQVRCCHLSCCGCFVD